MNARTLRTRSLRHYWRTNAAVVLGVATAVAVLAGSLLVGESVRASLANLALERLGQVSESVTSPRFFREGLAADLANQPGFTDHYKAASPLLALQGSVSRPESGQRAGQVLVYGVDSRFFELNGVEPPQLEGRNALLSPALDEELKAATGAPLVVVVESASDIPASTALRPPRRPGRSASASRAPACCAATASAPSPSVPPRRRCAPIFLPLATLQKALGLDGRVNTLIVSDKDPADDNAPPSTLTSLVARSAQLEELGLKIRELPTRGALALESATGLIGDDAVTTAMNVAKDRNLTRDPASSTSPTPSARTARRCRTPWSRPSSRKDARPRTEARHREWTQRSPAHHAQRLGRERPRSKAGRHRHHGLLPLEGGGPPRIRDRRPSK
jgi:hypothetical protein